MRFLKHFAAAAIGGVGTTIVASHAAAQSVEDLRSLSIDQLAKIEVTSVARRPEPLSKAAASIFVITGDDIRRSGATNLAEALRLAPNLDVERLNTNQYAVSARGFNSVEASNKLLVLIDGRSVYSPLGAQVYWQELNVDLDDIDRIEVVSGPGGTLYGANAVNGVINVITKDSKDTQGGLVDAGGGNFDKGTTLRYGGRIDDKTTYRVYGLGFDRSHTLPAIPGQKYDDAFGGLQTGFRGDRSDHSDTYTLEGDIYRNVAYDLAQRLAGGNVLGRWTHQSSQGSNFQLQAYYQNEGHSLVGLRESLDTYDVQGQHNFQVGGAHNVVWGGEWRMWHDNLVSSGPFLFATPSKTIQLVNVFGEDAIALRRDLTLTLGSKLEYNSFSGIDPLPSGRLAWQVTDNHLLWAAISRAVRTPSRIDRSLQAAGILNPSPNFESEKLIAYEAGYRGEFSSRFSGSVSLYYNQYDDVRTDNFAPGGGFPITLRNGLEGDTYGFEAWASYAPLSWWRLRPGLSYIHESFQLKPGNTDFSAFQALGQDPAYQLKFRSEMDVMPTVEFDVEFRHVAHPKHSIVSDYSEASARIGWRVPHAIELSLEGDNLLHAKHIEVYDPSTAPPRYIPRAFYIRLRTGF